MIREDINEYGEHYITISFPFLKEFSEEELRKIITDKIIGSIESEILEKFTENTELNKLEAYLKEHGYEYERTDHPCEFIKNGMWRQIIVYKDGVRQWDAVCNFGSYGHEQGLLEIYGNIVDEEKHGDSVIGWLTAEDIIKILEEDENAENDSR